MAESDAGRVVSKRPDSGRAYPNVRAVIPSQNDGTVVLSGAAVRDALKTAKKRKLQSFALVVRDGAAGMEFYENIGDAEGDSMRVSLPCIIPAQSRNAVILFSANLFERAIGRRISKSLEIKYNDDTRAATINNCALIMPILNHGNVGFGFTPDYIAINTDSIEQAEPQPERQRIVELPDGTYIVIGGAKPKGGRAVKAWIVNGVEI